MQDAVKNRSKGLKRRKHPSLFDVLDALDFLDKLKPYV